MHDALLSIIAYAHLLHPTVPPCDLINELAKKLAHRFEAKKQGTESTTYVTMTPISSLKSSCSALCSPLLRKEFMAIYINYC